MFAGFNSIKNPQNYRPPPRRGIQAAVEFPRKSRGIRVKTKPPRSGGGRKFVQMYYNAGFSEKRFNLLPAKSRVIQGCQKPAPNAINLPPTELRLPFQIAIFQGGARKGAAGLESGQANAF